MTQRLEVARMLKNGEKYDKIEESTGASTATISRVKRCLQYGADGYAKRLTVSAGRTRKNEHASAHAFFAESINRKQGKGKSQWEQDWK